jgi:hypothetical protein
MRQAVAERGQELCTCGKVWEGPVHFTADGVILDYIVSDVTHVPTGYNGIMRKAFTAVQAGYKVNG